MIFPFIKTPCYSADKVSETEIKTILKFLKDRKPETRLKGLLFAPQTNDERVFEQLIKMYSTRNKIRPNVFQALIRLNQVANGKYSSKLVRLVKNEIARLQKISNIDTYKYISQFIGYVTDTPDPEINSFVSWTLSNLEKLVKFRSLRNELEIKCVAYFALQNKPEYINLLLKNYYSNKVLLHSNSIVQLFIKNKDPRIFDSIIAEIGVTPAPSVFLIDLLSEYAKAINKKIPSPIQEKMHRLLADFDNTNKIEEDF